MKRFSIIVLVVLIAVFAFADKGRAGYLPDDGTELFYPNDTVLGIEVWDFGGSFSGSTFGFFFTDMPGTLIPIFGPSDETVSGDLQSALIYFNTGTVLDGVVWDVDDGALQASFTPNPDTAIGFYYSVLGSTFFTDASLNTGGQDLAATFPHDTNAGKYLISFQSLNGDDIAFEVVTGITPVPEPSTMLLFGAGLVAAAGYSFRKRQRKTA